MTPFAKFSTKEDVFSSSAFDANECFATRRKKGLFSLKNFFFDWGFFHPGKQQGIFAFLSSENSTLLVFPTFCVTKKTDKSILIYIHRT